MLTRTSKTSKDYKVLVIDDDSVIRTAVVQALRTAGFRDIISIPDGPKGLDVIASHGIDLILCDNNMEPMSGLTFAAKLRSLSWAKDIPLMMMSGLPEDKQAFQARRLMVADWLVKPFHTNVIVQKSFSLLNIGDAEFGDNSIDVPSARYEAKLPKNILNLCAILEKIESHHLNVTGIQEIMLELLTSIQGQAAVMGYGLVSEISGWLRGLQRLCVAHPAQAVPLQGEIIHLFRLASRIMQTVAEKRLHGHGGEAGEQVRKQFKPVLQALHSRFDKAIDAEKNRLQAIQTHIAIKKQEAEAIAEEKKRLLKADK